MCTKYERDERKLYRNKFLKQSEIMLLSFKNAILVRVFPRILFYPRILMLIIEIATQFQEPKLITKRQKSLFICNFKYTNNTSKI